MAKMWRAGRQDRVRRVMERERKGEVCSFSGSRDGVNEVCSSQTDEGDVLKVLCPFSKAVRSHSLVV